MLRNANSESEILLGNTQLIGIFFLLAVLLGVAFTAGFMLGHGSFGKKAEAVATGAPATSSSDTGPRTAVVEPAVPAATTPESTGTEPAPTPASPSTTKAEKTTEDVPKPAKKPPTEEPAPKPRSGSDAFAPQPGQTFLQVAAELHDSAASAASVLNKSGFNAHVALAPNGKLFRVLVGPVKDKNDLAATRDALKAKGFLTVIVRTY